MMAKSKVTEFTDQFGGDEGTEINKQHACITLRTGLMVMLM